MITGQLISTAAGSGLDEYREFSVDAYGVIDGGDGTVDVGATNFGRCIGNYDERDDYYDDWYIFDTWQASDDWYVFDFCSHEGIPFRRYDGGWISLDTYLILPEVRSYYKIETAQNNTGWEEGARDKTQIYVRQVFIINEEFDINTITAAELEDISEATHTGDYLACNAGDTSLPLAPNGSISNPLTYDNKAPIMIKLNEYEREIYGIYFTVGVQRTADTSDNTDIWVDMHWELTDTNFKIIQTGYE